MKKYQLIILGLLLSVFSYSQNLWIPSGTLGTSNNSNVGIGVGLSNPAAKLEIKSEAISGSELLSKFWVSDAANDYLSISNATGESGQFMPVLKANNESSNRTALYLFAQTSTNNDNGTYPIMVFDARLDGAVVSTRPLFTWRNYGQEKMTMLANGNIGIGTTTPGEKLEINGNLKLKTDGEMTLNPHLDVTELNPGATTAAASITNRIYGHLVMDIYPNDLQDAFAVRYDQNFDGVMDKIPFLVNGYGTRVNGKFILGDGTISSSSSTDLSFQTNGTTRMTIDNSTGKVGIGTTIPTGKLEITSSGSIGSGEYFDWSKAALRINQNSGYYIMGFDGNQITTNKELFLTTQDVNAHISFQIAGNTKLRLNGDGNVGIGTTNPTSKLTVKGEILASKVKVVDFAEIPDYVFEKDYDLKSIEELELYVSENKHLPDVPAGKEITEKGMDLAELNIILLKKLEEQALYIIDINNRLKELEAKLDANKE